MAAVVLGASVLGRICERRETPLLGALALALSPSAITLSGVAESYTLCTAFVLAATRAYLGLIAPPPEAGRGREAAGFALFASLALLSHYAAGLFLLAAAAAPLAIAALEPEYRRAWRAARAPRLAAVAAAFLAPLVVAGVLYRLLARPWLHRLSHVEEFYLAPGRETIPAFLGRALAATFDLFAPFSVGAPAAAAGLLLAFLALVTAIAVRADRRRGGPGPPSATPAVLLVLLVALEAAAGVAGRYPFGGGMRHQFLLLLFAILAGAAALDRALVRRPRAAPALVGVAVLAIVANWFGHLDRRWRPRPEPFAAERARFDADFPGAREIHVDQFNLVAFFAQHHDWDWEFRGSVGARPSVQRYRVSRDGRAVDLVAHRDVWNFDPGSPDTYRAVAETPASPVSTTAALFDIRLPTDPASDAEALRERIPALARRAGLETRRLEVDGPTVFAEFRRSRIAPTSP